MMPILLGLTAALLALALATTQTIIAQREARAQAMHEGDTLFVLQSVMRIMLEAESNQRGYVLTGDRAYLPRYLDARQRLAPTIAELRKSARRADDDDTLGRVNWIVGLTDAKFTEMDRTVALTRTGMRSQAEMITASDMGRQQMDAIHAAIAGESLRKAEQRRDAFNRAADFEKRLVPLIAVLGAAIVALVVAGFRAERNRAMEAAEARQAGALREANERAELLARELNHRVQNLFSVVLSIVTLSGRKRPSGGDVVETIRSRIHALSLAHSASQGSGQNASVELGSVVANTMRPYADDEGRRITVTGPNIRLPIRAITPLGMIVHELATNAVKYGALSVESGRVDISWQVTECATGPELTLCWSEAGGPALFPDERIPAKVGFGSQMTSLAARQLGGTIVHDWRRTGAIIRLVFPLEDNPSPGGDRFAKA